jgi:hypothetical protein
VCVCVCHWEIWGVKLRARDPPDFLQLWQARQVKPSRSSSAIDGSTEKESLHHCTTANLRTK